MAKGFLAQISGVSATSLPEKLHLVTHGVQGKLAGATESSLLADSSVGGSLRTLEQKKVHLPGETES